MIACRAARGRGKSRLGQLLLSLGLSLCALTAQAAPTVSITNPVADSIIPAPASITVTADATDTAGTITKVDFYQGATLIGTATAAPYSATWTNAPAGTYPLTATATNDSNETATSAPVQIIVNAPPTVSLTSPTANQTYIAPASIILTANAADSDGTVAKVEYYQGATLIGSATAAPYTATWQNTLAGTYTLTAKATDNNGATTTAVAIPITVIPNQLPSITLTTPTAGQHYTAPATINLTASAQDIDGQITRVEYYQGTTLIGSATAAPYAATWQNIPEGQYSLTAKAIDNGGGETYSSAVGITVDPAGRKIYYLHSDHLNTPRVVTDEQNRIVWRNAPLGEPFGNAAPEEDPDGDGILFTLNLRFPGQYFDRETNLNYNYFRDYNSEAGRYIESDPIGLAGGINTYAYVGGSPVSKIDPLGLANADPRSMTQSGGGGGGAEGFAILGAVVINGIVNAINSNSKPSNDSSSSSDSEKKKGVEEWNKNPPINPGQYSCRYVMYFPEDQCKDGKCPPFVTGRGYAPTLKGAMSQARTEAQEKIPPGCGHQHHGQMWCRYGGGPPFMP